MVWWINVPQKTSGSNNKTTNDVQESNSKNNVFQHLGRVFLILGVFFINTIGWLRVCKL